MRITSKGQVTIPLAIREKFGLEPGTDISFEPAGEFVRIRKAPGGRGRMIVDRLRGRATTRMTTDEIMALTRGDR